MRTLTDQAIARLWIGDEGNRPVRIVRGRTAPRWTGRGWHYTTITGIEIDHPSAYSRKGWSNMVYHASTHAVEVGREWLRAMRRTIRVIDGTRVAGRPALVHGLKVYRTLRRGGKGMLVAGLGRTYHTGVTEPRLAVEEALRSWHRQRVTDRAESGLAEAIAHAEETWVTIADSIRAGNCESETIRFRDRLAAEVEAEKIRRTEEGEVGAVRGDAILAIRDDAYTRRAVAVAYQS